MLRRAHHHHQQQHHGNCYYGGARGDSIRNGNKALSKEGLHCFDSLMDVGLTNRDRNNSLSAHNESNFSTTAKAAEHPSHVSSDVAVVVPTTAVVVAASAAVVDEVKDHRNSEDSCDTNIAAVSSFAKDTCYDPWQTTTDSTFLSNVPPYQANDEEESDIVGMKQDENDSLEGDGQKHSSRKRKKLSIHETNFGCFGWSAEQDSIFDKPPFATTAPEETLWINEPDAVDEPRDEILGRFEKQSVDNVQTSFSFPNDKMRSPPIARTDAAARGETHQRSNARTIMASDVRFGLITHPGTIRWRQMIKEISDNLVGFPGCPSDIDIIVKSRLYYQDGIHQYMVCVDEHGIPLRKLFDQNKQCLGTWRHATDKEIFDRTKQRFLDDRKVRKKSDASEFSLPSLSFDEQQPVDVRRHDVPSPYPMSDDSVCFDWNHHSGTIQWRAAIKLFADDELNHPKWNNAIVGLVRHRLASMHNVKQFLVFLNSQYQPTDSIKDGLWYLATDDVIREKTRLQFLEYRRVCTKYNNNNNNNAENDHEEDDETLSNVMGCRMGVGYGVEPWSDHDDNDFEESCLSFLPQNNDDDDDDNNKGLCRGRRSQRHD